MAMLWRDEYSVHEDRIDEQHKRLFQFVNKLEDQMKRGVKKDEIDSCMTFLSTYVRIHFLYEESCMFRHKCPIADTNVAAHKKFLEAFDAIKAKYDVQGPTPDVITELYNAASNWLIQHICKIDKQLAPYVTGAA